RLHPDQSPLPVRRLRVFAEKIIRIVDRRGRWQAGAPVGPPFVRLLRRRSALLVWAACACICSQGCGGGETSSAAGPPPSFSGPPALSVASSSGALGTAV